VFPLDEYQIPFVKALQLIIDLILDSAFAFLGLAMIPLARLPGTKADVIDIALWYPYRFTRLQGGDAQGVNNMCFRQVPVLAVRGCFITKHRCQRSKRLQSGIQMRFSLHGPLGNLVQMTTYPCYLERDFALVQLMMAMLTERQQIGQRVFAASSTEDEMMGFQSALTLAAGLAAIPIAHEAGHAQVLIQPRWILVLTSLEFGVVQTGNIHLDVLDDKRTDREGKPLYDADDFLHIRFNRRGQPSAPLA